MNQLEQKVRGLDQFFIETVGWDSELPPQLFVQVGDLFGPIDLPAELWQGQPPSRVMALLARGVIPLLTGVPVDGGDPVAGVPDAIIFTCEAYEVVVEDREEYDAFVRPLAEQGRIRDHPLHREVRHFVAVTKQRELFSWCRYRDDEETELGSFPDNAVVIGSAADGLIALMDAFQVTNDRMN